MASRAGNNITIAKANEAQPKELAYTGGMLSPSMLDQLVAEKATSPEMERIMKAVLKRESAYGQNPAAYRANPAGGVIGPGQIQSKAVGGKYNNFENYADAGQTDVTNPVHNTRAALNMMADLWTKAKGNPQTFVNGYFGRAAKDKLGGKNSDYVAAISNALANGVTTPTDAGYRTSPTGSAFSQVTAGSAYNKDMIGAATKFADRNQQALDTFKWDSRVKGNVASAFGNAVAANTSGLTDIANQNAEYLKAFTAPTAETKLGRMADRVGAMFKVSGNTLLEEYYNKQQDRQSLTGKAMDTQVADYSKVLNQTAADPRVFESAAKIAQGDVGLTNDQQRLTLAEEELAVARERIAAEERMKANAQNAAVSGKTREELVAQYGEAGADAVSRVVTQDGALGNDPYTAVKAVEAMGDKAPPELARQAAEHKAFQDSVTQNLQGLIPITAAMSKEQQVAANANNDQLKRTAINKAYAEAANGIDKSNYRGNPYTPAGQVAKLSNGVTLPKGITAEQVTQLSLGQLLINNEAAGGNAMDVATFYKTLASKASEGKGLDRFSAPKASGKFMVKLEGTDNYADLTTAAGVEKVKATLRAKANGAQAGESNWLSEAFRKLTTMAPNAGFGIDSYADPYFNGGTAVNKPIK